MITRSSLPFSPGASGPLLRADDLSWQDSAACQYVDADLWFPEQGGSTRRARRICRDCAVRAECLQYALDNEEPHGVWGGLSPEERLRLQRIRPGAPQSRRCRSGRHVMDEDNTAADGRCLACDREQYARNRPAGTVIRTAGAVVRGVKKAAQAA